MKREADYFAGTEPELIFVAKRLRDAISLESLLAGGRSRLRRGSGRVRGRVDIQIDARGSVLLSVRPETRERAVALMVRTATYRPNSADQFAPVLAGGEVYVPFLLGNGIDDG